MPTDRSPRQPADPDARRPLGRPHPGARRRRALGQHLAPGRRGRRARPGDPRDDPVRQGQLAAERRHGPRRVVRGPRLRAVPGRRPRDGVVGRRRARRVHRRPRPQDGYDAVEWLAAQPWCTGAVGMWGISYGGFTAIQVAKLRPPHLRAIVPFQATDDRYLTDVHYIGGCVTASELSQYAVSQVAMNAMPPDASFRGDAWLDEWRARLEATPPWLIEWVRQQTDGPYWRNGSLAPRVRRHRGGDPERRRLERRLRRRGVPDAGAMHGAAPDARRELGPRLAVERDARPEPRRAPRGRPLLRSMAARARRTASMTSRRSSGSSATTRSRSRTRRRGRAGGGRPSAFPHPATREVAWRFAGGALPLVGGLGPRRDGTGGGTASTAASAGIDRYRHRPALGTRAGLSWGAGSEPNGLARDLRPDESLGPTYTSEPLTEPVSVLGEPVVVLHLAVDAPVATAVVRLTDVAPDGTSSWVSAGILNLTHRRSDTDPEPMVPGRDRGDPRPAAARRVSVRAGASDPGLRGVVGLAGDLAVAVSGDLRAAPRRRDAVAAGPAGHPGRRGRGRSAGPGLQDDAAGPPRGRRRGLVRRAASGGSRRTSSGARPP